MSRVLNLPRRARVRTSPGGAPVEVDGRAIELVRESWLVEDRWWSERPLQRRYWELLSTSGQDIVVFRDLGAPPRRQPPPSAAPARGAATGWFVQRP
jgi:hypothetical protein